MAFAPLLFAVGAIAQIQVIAPPPAGSSPLMTAATDAAVANLKSQIDALPLGPSATVGQYLTVTKSHDIMRTAISQAPVIGGPRAIDANTLQVRVDLAATAVVNALNKIAAANPKIAGFGPKEVAAHTRAWSDRTFTATGTASLNSAANPPGTAPDLNPAQAAPGPATPPAEAVAAARTSAATGLIGKLEVAQLPTGQSARDLLALPGVKDAVSAVINAAPLKSSTTGSTGELTIVLTLDRAAVADAIRVAAKQDVVMFGANRDALIAAMPAELSGIARPSIPLATIPSGQAPGPAIVQAGTTQAPVTFPIDTPPAWFYNTIDVGGTASFQGSKLLTARIAETEAIKSLKSQLEELPLSKELKLRDAIKADPKLGDALSRALDRARVYKIDYLEDGSAAVRVSTDTRYLWQDLISLRLR